MESNGRRIGLYAATGVLVAVLVVAGLFFAGVQFPGILGVKAETGMLVVLLTDAPVNLTHLNVTIDGFSVHCVKEGWIPLEFDSGEMNVTFDILELYNETMKLTNDTLPVGNYTKMRMSVVNASATYDDGKFANLTVPSGKLDIIIHFELESKEIEVVLIDIQPDWAAISKTNHFRPVLKASIVELT